MGFVAIFCLGFLKEL